MFFVCNPLRARFWFNWREPIAVGISGCFFAVICGVLWLGFDALVIGLISAVIVSVLVKFVWLDKMVLVIKCPNPECGEFIEIDTPWLCGYKQDEVEHENVNTSEYPFVRECEHCHKKPKAYQCHHCEKKELIFLSVDHDKQNYAKRLGDVKTIVDSHVVKVTQKLEKIQAKTLDYEMAKLEQKIKFVKNSTEEPEELTQEREIENIMLDLEKEATILGSYDEAVRLLLIKAQEGKYKDNLHGYAQYKARIENGAKQRRLKKLMEGK
jgi:hypothetical protein